MTEPRTRGEMLLSWLGAATPEIAEEEADRLQEINRELVRGFGALAHIDKAVSVFGSARTPPEHPDYRKATEVARVLGAAGYSIITGAGPGIMEAANRGAREAGAGSIGCNIKLRRPQPVNRYVDLQLDFDHFFARKVIFVRYASGFVIHPGGFGTMDELFEALNLISTATIQHFPVVLVGSDHWGGLLDWMEDHMVGSGELDPADVGLLRMSDDPDEVLAIIDEAAHRRRDYYAG